MAWIVAEEVMKSRCGVETRAFALWREATLSSRKLTGVERQLVLAFAEAVFKPAEDPDAPQSHGVEGYVAEWLWYLLSRELGDDLEHLSVPAPTVTDSGGDGLAIRRLPGDRETSLVFRLWEVKKHTAASSGLSATVTGAWDQLSDNGARYLALAQTAWADKHLAADVGDFVSTLVEQWVTGAVSAGGGVSVATNTATTPQRAFTRVHTRIPHLQHPGQLEGLIITIEDFAGFADTVRGLVWSAL